MALLDVRLATVAGSVALGFGEPFFAAAQAELDRHARIEYLHHPTVVPGGLGAEGPSSEPPRSACGPCLEGRPAE